MSINVHLYPSPFRTESRILRITGTLARAGLFEHIYIVATHQAGLLEVEPLDDRRTVLRIRTYFDPDAGRVRRYLALIEWAIRIWLRMRTLEVSVVNAHSVPTLPVALLFRRRRQAVLVYDTHEIETEQYYSTTPTKVISQFIERRCIGDVDVLVATSDGHGEWYRRTYGLDEVTVVKNFPLMREDHGAASDVLRRHCDLSPGDRLFIYLGLIAPGRGIELLLEVFSETDRRRHLVFMGFGPQVPLVQEWASRHGNIHYHPAVPPDRVHEYLQSCDVGLCIIEDRCLSYRHTLPNKLLECLNVGVPVIVSNFPDMAAAVSADDCGWAVEPAAEPLRILIEMLSDEDIEQKRRGARCWAAKNTWQTQEVILRSLYERIGGGTRDPSRAHVAHESPAPSWSEL